MPHDADARLAADLAAAAAELLLEIRASGLAVDKLGDEGDQRSNELILARLGAERPGDLVLSEESADDARRLTADRVWIIDPLDGTREFTEMPRTDWAVHVALWVDGDLAAGAVALPAQGVVLGTHRPAVLPPPHGGRPRLVVSRTRPPALAQAVADRLGAELVPMGSAGAKATSVVLGASDVYLHGGGQWEWDSAAPVAVCRAAGLHTSRLDSTPLVYNQPTPWLPDLLICRPELAGRVFEAIGAVTDADPPTEAP